MTSQFDYCMFQWSSFTVMISSSSSSQTIFHPPKKWEMVGLIDTMFFGEGNRAIWQWSLHWPSYDKFLKKHDYSNYPSKAIFWKIAVLTIHYCSSWRYMVTKHVSHYCSSWRYMVTNMFHIIAPAEGTWLQNMFHITAPAEGTWLQNTQVG